MSASTKFLKLGKPVDITNDVVRHMLVYGVLITYRNDLSSYLRQTYFNFSLHSHWWD